MLAELSKYFLFCQPLNAQTKESANSLTVIVDMNEQITLAYFKKII
jgi:hypothetical protein